MCLPFTPQSFHCWPFYFYPTWHTFPMIYSICLSLLQKLGGYRIPDASDCRCRLDNCLASHLAESKVHWDRPKDLHPSVTGVPNHNAPHSHRKPLVALSGTKKCQI